MAGEQGGLLYALMGEKKKKKRKTLPEKLKKRKYEVQRNKGGSHHKKSILYAKGCLSAIKIKIRGGSKNSVLLQQLLMSAARGGGW